MSRGWCHPPRWRGWTGRALLAGLLAGVALVAAAGARRTESSYPRLLEHTSAGYFLVSTAVEGLGSGSYEEVAQLPHVAVAGTLAGVMLDEDLRPADVSNYERVQSTPVVLAGLLVALAVAALAHTLATWVRQRRRDVGVLRALGFVKGQVVPAWHGSRPPWLGSPCW